MKFSTKLAVAAVLSVAAVVLGAGASPVAAKPMTSEWAYGPCCFSGGVAPRTNVTHTVSTPPRGSGMITATLRGTGLGSNMDLIVRDQFGNAIAVGAGPTDQEQVTFAPTGGKCTLTVRNLSYAEVEFYTLRLTFVPAQ